MRFLIVILLFTFHVSGQQSTAKTSIMLGNCGDLCLPDSTILHVDSLPDDLSTISTVFLFSSSTSNLSENDVERLTDFVDAGGGLYAGADNWPLQSQSNQLTQRMYKKQSYGAYDQANAESTTDGNLKLEEMKGVPAGKTTVAFPLDYRLNVEAWVSDQPLILTGTFGAGRIIIDGGYSRFYCDAKKEESDSLFEKFNAFLEGD